MSASSTAASISRTLGLTHSEGRWAAELEAIGPPEHPVVLPGPQEAADLLTRLGVAGDDAAAVLETMPSPASTPEWWWLLERARHRLTQTMGNPDSSHLDWPHWSGPEADWSLQQRCFMPHVFLATLPHTMAWHRSRGIPEHISWATMADLGRHMALHRRVYGVAGVDAPWWLTMCLRAELFELGRLQFNWFRLGVSDDSPPWYPDEEADRRGTGFRPGDVCVGVHIPEIPRPGSPAPLTPSACDDSFAQAKGFFAEYLLAERVGAEHVVAEHVSLRGQSPLLATCWSWLLDDQLEQWLPARSNIMSFQRRFELVPGGVESDEVMLGFVFRVPDPLGQLDDLPQETLLQRAAVAHLRAGNHWRSRTGWVKL